jgi:hypothetical protein
MEKYALLYFIVVALTAIWMLSKDNDLNNGAGNASI